VSGAKGNIDEKKLSSWKLLDNFRQRLAKAQAAFPKSEKRPGGPVRLLLEKDYFSLMLFGLLNPVLDSMRGLCACQQPIPILHFSSFIFPSAFNVQCSMYDVHRPSRNDEFRSAIPIKSQ
jgi:hypothetical protein